MKRDRSIISGRVWVIVLLVLVLIAGLAVGYGVYRRARRAGAPAVKAAQLWTCPMHPSVVRPKPGNCPICGMKLVPMEPAGPKTGTDRGIEGHGVVEIDPQKQQLIGVVTAPVELRPLERVLRTVGLVMVDEARTSHVHTKVEGWIEKLYAAETNRLVRKGEPLLTIYSPELVSTQEEYLLALRSRQRLAKSPFPEVRESGDSLLRATRDRLRLWDIPEKDIERLENSGRVVKALTLYSPATGYILKKEAIEGMRVTPGMALYELADLSRVWVEADVYEFEAPLVRPGQRARLTLASQPGKAFSGRVAYIYPTVSEKTRTLKARFEFANPGLALRPEMYADVEILVPSEKALAIPQEAVLDSGTRKVVFVQKGEGKFLPREVTLGPRAAGYYPVLSGLKEGERVVSSPNFLIDSESRFQAALEAVKAGAGEHAGHGR
jgi:multidrug efflux pump subunit AcrA (membrane-fusion protein)